MDKEKIILGIDPGTILLGYGLLLSQKNKMELIALGVVELHKYDDAFLKLQKIFERVILLIDQFHPDELAIEAPFYGKNIQVMLKLGRAQGVAMAAALSRSLPIFEYSPRKIKQAITGNGNAAKEQVAGFLKGMLHIDPMPEKLDATDGLAVAVCHHLQNKILNTGTSFNSWKDFINKNPGRVK
jgi:crossover junction endodeoxyribonuclease RuvC